MKLLFENWRGYLKEESMSDEDWKQALRRWEELLFAIKSEEGYMGREGADPYIEVSRLEDLLFRSAESPYNLEDPVKMRSRAEKEGTSIPPLDDE